jgi:hypothetical protein
LKEPNIPIILRDSETTFNCTQAKVIGKPEVAADLNSL